MSDPAPAASPPADPAIFLRTAIAIREDVDRGAGELTRSADDLFDRFGFVPASYDEQRHIEEALTGAGVRVEPLDPSGRQIRLLRSEPEPAPTPSPVPAARIAPTPPAPREDGPGSVSSGRWTIAAMVVVVVLALGGAAGGIKYLHDLAARNQHRQAATQSRQAPSAPARQQAPAPPSDFLGD